MREKKGGVPCGGKKGKKSLLRSLRFSSHFSHCEEGGKKKPKSHDCPLTSRSKERGGEKKKGRKKSEGKGKKRGGERGGGAGPASEFFAVRRDRRKEKRKCARGERRGDPRQRTCPRIYAFLCPTKEKRERIEKKRGRRKSSLYRVPIFSTVG